MNELVLINKDLSIDLEDEDVRTALAAIFSSKDGAAKIVDQVRELVDSFEHDLSTGAGRAKTISLAANVSKTKTTLDGFRKVLIKEWKDKVDNVNGSWRLVREECDALRDKAREPVTQWENDQRILAEELKAKEEAKALAKQKENDHEIAILLDEKLDRDIAEAKAEADRIAEVARLAEIQAQKDRDEQIRKEASEKAEADKLAAEAREKQAIIDKENAQAAKVEADKKAEELRIQNEKDRIENARLAKIEYEKQARIVAENARLAKIEAEGQAKVAAENARLAEVKRQESEAAQIKADADAREADKKHIGKIWKAAKEDLMQHCGLSEVDAKKVVKAIAQKLISSAEIKY